MHGLQGLSLLLLMQALGEGLARLLTLPLPGPVVGMALLLLALRWPWVQERVAAVATFLLSHLSLLFVPVGVGVVSHLPLLQAHGWRMLLVLVLSTWLGLLATAMALRALLPHQPTAQRHD
jgi:holin-like protein